MADEKQVYGMDVPSPIDLEPDKEIKEVSEAGLTALDRLGKIPNHWWIHSVVSLPYTTSSREKVGVMEFGKKMHPNPFIVQTLDLPFPTTALKPKVAPEEAMQKAFEEIAASGSRILKTIERLNSLAEETYNELNVTNGSLSPKGKA